MRRLWLPVLVGAAVVLVLTVWLRPRTEPQPKIAPVPAAGPLLVRLPAQYRPASLSISDDGSDYAFVIQPSDGCAVVERNRVGPVFAECGRPQFAPVSKQVFYWATESLPAYRRLFNWVRNWGAPAQRIPVLVINHQVVAPGFVYGSPLIFNTEGTRWAVAGRAPEEHVGNTTTPGAVTVLADGRVLGRYKDASLPVFSRDGTHLAYLVQSDDEQVKLIVDGSEQRSFTRPANARPEITQGGSSGLSQQLRVAYLSDGTLMAIVPGGAGWIVYRGDQEVASYEYNVVAPEAGLSVNVGAAVGASTAVVAQSLSIAEKAAVVAWWERLPGKEEQWRVTRNDAPDAVVCARFWKDHVPVLSADGRHLAYPCYVNAQQEDDKVMVVADGKQFGPYENAAGLTFSDDGAHFAYMASDGSKDYDWSYHVDGKQDLLKFAQVWPPRFNENGAHIAWEAERGLRPMLFLDGRGVRSFDEVLWGPVFSSKGTVAWVVLRGRRVLRVEKTVTSDK